VTQRDLAKFIRLLSRRRWLVVGVFGITLAVVVAGAMLMPLYYHATTVVMSSTAAQKDPLSMIPTGPGGGSVDRYQQDTNQAIFMGLAKSPEVLRRAEQALGLGLPSSQFSQLFSLDPVTGMAFGITAYGKTADDAIKMANGIAVALRDYYAEQSQLRSGQYRQGLEERVQKLHEDMEATQADLVKLHSDDVMAPSGANQSNALESRLNTLQAELEDATTVLGGLRQRSARTQREMLRQPLQLESETTTTDTVRVSAMEGELSRLMQDLAAAKSRYTERNPEVVRLQSHIAQVQADLATARRQLDTKKTWSPNPVRADLSGALVRLRIDEAEQTARIASFQEVMARIRDRMRSSGSKQVTMSQRLADFEAEKALYQNLSQMLRTVSVEQEARGGMPEILIWQAASMAEGPAPRKGPNREQLLTLGLLLSIFLGIGSAVVVESMDVGLKSAEEVQTALQLPLSASIPLVVGEERKALPQITRALPVSPYAEAYRFLRTSILSDGYHHNVRSLMMTAVSPGQGNTTTIANLALSLAETGRRVVLIDCDLRRPRQHGVFGVSNAIGMTNLLTGTAELDEALQPTDVDGLVVLTAGPQAQNPSALLNSARMRQVIEALKDRFDYVLVDTPPVLAFSDSVALSGLVDGTILTVRVGDASRGNEVQAKTILEKAGARIIGVVVNGLAAQQIDSFHYHAHYYGHPALPVKVEAPVEGEVTQ
jgi:polysaccharide biosynthesis transport protein